MPSYAHEVLVVMLREQPERLDALLSALGLPSLPAGLSVVDSALRLVDPVEVRPDLVLAAGEKGPWVMVEVQLDEDEVKRRRWPLAMSLLFDARGQMGDLVVLTAKGAVATWASEVARATGPMGTELSVRPVVVLLSGATVEVLLSDEHPELGFFAAWAMHDRGGPAAQRVVRRALDLASALPDRLQRAQIRAIFNVLSEPMLAWLEEVAMDSQLPLESPAVRAWREELERRGEARGVAQGETRALLAVLAARGLSVDESTRAIILATTDPDTLERWIQRAVTASSLDAVFSED